MNKLPNVYNLHFTDYCNYKCSYCFVKKENKMLSLDQIKTVIDHIDKYFKTNKLNGRINLVGGEPLTCPFIQDIIDYIYQLGIEISIVTNGSLLNSDFIINNKNKLKMIGISVDSLTNKTNLKIGRCCGLKTMDTNKLITICKLIKDNGIQLKINLCLSKLNEKEDMTDFIEQIKPDRFKIFQMTVIDGINNFSKCLQLNKKQFDDACEKYIKYNAVIESEEDMKSSYLMVDSKGDLFIDKEEKPLFNLINETIKEKVILDKLDIKTFINRYA